MTYKLLNSIVYAKSNKNKENKGFFDVIYLQHMIRILGYFITFRTIQPQKADKYRVNYN